MNSYATLMFVYTLITLISSSILYGAFRKKVDASAVYFLISEFCMTATCGTLFLININFLAPTTPWTGIPILTTLSAEVAILFSILSLTKKIEKKWFLLAITAIALIATFLELFRSELQPRTIILIISICLTSLFTINYLICKFRIPEDLRANPFVMWFTWFELGMVGYGVVRILGYLSSTPIRPWDTPSAIALIIFSFYVVLGTFRYISYIGIRITLVNHPNPSENLLNKRLTHEVKEKAQLLRGLMASNRIIGISALASSLAHQLSQPLTTIALRADTTRRGLGQITQDPSILASLDEISIQSSKLAELVKNLRQLFGSRGYQFAKINLQTIADEVIEIVQPSFKEKNITFLKNYEGEQIIFGDSIQLQQVLINIINNAIDALMLSKVGDKKIFLKIASSEKFAEIEIRDCGGGIDRAILPNIFELYKTTKQGGLGVGLWLSKTIIEQHHGHISAFNDSSGCAVFKIEIPMGDDLEAAQ